MRTLFYTTMVSHRPVYTSSVPDPLPPHPEPQQFRPTMARDPTITANPNHPPQRSLGDLLARSTQPIFSVSALFRMKVGGGGCGACGH
jgi:hypothetical protein